VVSKNKTVYQIIVELEGDKKTKAAIEDIGKASGVAGAALIALSAAAGKAAADYETSLSSIATVSDETTGTTEEFSQALVELNKETEGLINIQESAASAYDVLSAGIKDQEGVLTALEQAQKGAIVGQSTQNEITKAAVSIVNSYGEELGVGSNKADQFSKAIDGIIQTQLDGVITGGEYARQIGQIASLAKNSGVAIDELNGAIATSTALGTPASVAFTQLKAAVSNISKPTKKAKEEAARLGIQWDAATLQSQGLEATLRQLSEAGNLNAASLGQLFESTEAVAIVTQLLDGDMQRLNQNIENQGQALGQTDEQLKQFKDDVNFRVTKSLNLLNTAFIQLGQGALVAFEPVINALATVAGVLSETDPKVLQFVGTMTAITGVALTLNGAILILAASFGSMKTNIVLAANFMNTKLLPALGKMILSAKSATTTQIALNGAIKGTTLALGPWVAIVGGAAVAALIAYTALLKESTDALDAFQGAIDVTGDGTINLAEKIKRLSEQDVLSPEQKEQLKGYIKLAKEQADTIQENIDKLEKENVVGEANTNRKQAQLGDLQVQQNLLNNFVEKGTAALEGNTEASNENSDATGDNADAASDAAEKWDNYVESINNSVDALKEQADIDVARVNTGSEAEDLGKIIAIRQKAYEEETRLLLDLKNQSQTTADERLAIERELARRSNELNEERNKANQRLEELYNQTFRNGLETRKQLLEAQLKSNQISKQEYYDGQKKLLEETFNFEKNLLTEKLNTQKEGTAEYAQTVLDLQKLETQYITDTKNLEEQKQDLIKQKIEERKQAEEDRIKGQLEAIENAYALELEYINQINDQLEIKAQIQSNLDQSASNTQTIAQRLSDSLKNDNLTLSQRKDLLQLSSETFGTSLDINTALEQLNSVINNQEIAKLKIKQQQLDIEREQLQVNSEIAQLSFQQRREEINTQLGNKNLTTNERNQLQNELNSVNRQSQLEGKKTELALESNSLERGLVDFTIQLEKILQNTNESNTSKLLNAAGNEGTSSGSFGLLEAYRNNGLITNEEFQKAYDGAIQTDEKLAKEQEKLAEEREREKEANEKKRQEELERTWNQLSEEEQNKLLENKASVEDLTSSNQEGFDSLADSVMNANADLVDNTGAILKVNQNILQRLEFINRSIDALPSAIAARIPRPAPVRRD
jgi:TP901 family phage tail tape measure protein